MVHELYVLTTYTHIFLELHKFQKSGTVEKDKMLPNCWRPKQLDDFQDFSGFQE